MKTKYTEKQLNEAISYWRRQLKENFNMTDEQIDAELNEGLWDMLRHPIASFRDYQQPFKDKASITGLKNLISQQFKKDPEKCKKLQFWVKIGNDEFPVAGMQPMAPHKSFKLTTGKVLAVIPSNKKQADDNTVTVEGLNGRITADKLTLSKLSGICLALVDGNGISEAEIVEEEQAKAEEPNKTEEPDKAEEHTVGDDARSVKFSFNGKVVGAKLSPNKCTGAKVEPSKNRIVIGFDLTHVAKAKAKANGEDTDDNLGGLI